MRWRSRVLLLCVLFMLSPLTAVAQEGAVQPPDDMPDGAGVASPGEFSVAATMIEEWGNRGAVYPGDDATYDGVGCYHWTGSGTGTVDVAVRGPAIQAYYIGGQYVGWRTSIYQWNPNNTITWLSSSSVISSYAYQSSPTKFADFTFLNMPQGPVYVVAVELAWYVGGVVDGYRHYWMDAYRDVSNSRVGNRFDACYPKFPAGAALHSSRGTVNSKVYLTGAFFPLFYPATVQWGSKSVATLTTSDRGTFAGYLRVPATSMGTYNVIVSAGNGYVANAGTYTVVPRIKVIEGTVARGQSVDISLRGFAKKESVRIRWRNASGRWIELARVTTSNTGSANVYVTVPSWAPDGSASVRGDGQYGRAQTNVVYVSGGARLTVASAASPTASPTASPSPTATPSLTATPIASQTPIETVTVTETATATPSVIPTETPTELPTDTPTETPLPTETVEVTVTETTTAPLEEAGDSGG
jgi:cell division septation protein DedD